MWTTAPPELLWTALADPARWPSWAPQVAFVTRPGERQGPVIAGELLVVHGALGTRLPATVTRVEPGRRWDWRAGPIGPWSLQGIHEVLAVPGPGRPGHQVRVSMRVQGPVAALADRTALLVYAPLADLAVRRLAAVAADLSPAGRSGPTTRPPTGAHPGPGSSRRT